MKILQNIKDYVYNIKPCNSLFADENKSIWTSLWEILNVEAARLFY